MAIGAYTTALLTTRFADHLRLALPAGDRRDHASRREPRLSGTAAVRALSRPGDARLPRSGVDRDRGISRSHRRRSRSQTGEARARGLAPQHGALYYFVLGVTALAIRAGMEPSAFALWPCVRRGAAKRRSWRRRSPSRPRRTKLLAFSIAAAFAGLAGGLFTAVVGFIDPTEFDISASLRQITFIAVGGLGSVLGFDRRRGRVDAFARGAARREGI